MRFHSEDSKRHGITSPEIISEFENCKIGRKSGRGDKPDWRMMRMGMRVKVYLLMRDSHLFIGLFLSPFVLVFALSVLVLNHPGIPLGDPVESETRTLEVTVPAGIERMDPPVRVGQAIEILRQIGISGEIGFIGYSPEERKLSIPVQRPGYEARVDVILDSGKAVVKQRTTGFWEGLIFLHKMPGPHLANIRRNWFVTRVWGWLSDGTAWLMLFLSASGIYLWVTLKSGRRIGWMLMMGGIICLGGALCAIFI
jgi:hypothetical protein